jgi:hypothetical protein
VHFVSQHVFFDCAFLLYSAWNTDAVSKCLLPKYWITSFTKIIHGTKNVEMQAIACGLFLAYNMMYEVKYEIRAPVLEF